MLCVFVYAISMELYGEVDWDNTILLPIQTCALRLCSLYARKTVRSYRKTDFNSPFPVSYPDLSRPGSYMVGSRYDISPFASFYSCSCGLFAHLFFRVISKATYLTNTRNWWSANRIHSQPWLASCSQSERALHQRQVNLIFIVHSFTWTLLHCWLTRQSKSLLVPFCWSTAKCGKSRCIPTDCHSLKLQELKMKKMCMF